MPLIDLMRKVTPSLVKPVSEEVEIQRKPLRSLQPPLQCAASKYDFHGDDAMGYSSHCLVVADGVSGTKEASGALARALVHHVLIEAKSWGSLLTTKQASANASASASASASPLNASDFRAAVERAGEEAKEQTKGIGRLDTALTVVFFDPGHRKAFVYSIGDCKCIFVRHQRDIVFESTSVVYDFNVPAVVSTVPGYDCLHRGVVEEFDYLPGDVCLCFSDGVGDNLFVDEIVGCLKDCLVDGGETSVAETLVQLARAKVNQQGEFIPFSKGAAQACVAFAEEYKTWDAKNDSFAKQLELKCAALPSLQIQRAVLAKEKQIDKYRFYKIQQLMSFAMKSHGKEDDIAVCISSLT